MSHRLLLALLLAPWLAAQSPPHRAVLPKSAITYDAAAHLPDRIVVKLAEGSNRARARAAVEAVLGGRHFAPFFAGLEHEIAHLEQRLAAQGVAAAAGPDLRLYHVAHTRGPVDTRALLPLLNALDAVELAYPQERPAPPPGDIPPLTPSFVSRQGYHDPAPNGLDAAAARSLTGAWGKGTTLLDIEWGWDFDHEDIAVLRPSSLVGPPIGNHAYDNHGTAVFGELAGDPDQFGVTGFVPDIKALVATDYPSTGYSVAAAILVGLPYLKKGDVMLLEAQISTPLGLGPTEWVQADFDAILKATQAGIVVVEAAGNGGVNLDDARLNRAFDLTFRDSGAIIVGATNGSARVHAGFSCYGARIDANGWGANVATTGYGDIFNPSGDRKQHYTAVFSGTSSASPMVTSAVVALLSAARAQWSPERAALLDWKEVRRLLRTYGTPMDATSRPIGRRPDLTALFAGAGLERGLRLLDAVTIGNSFRLQITADFTPALGDAWILLAGPSAANVGIPGLVTPCDRLTLDPLSFAAIATGTFASGKTVTLPIPVPNDAALKLARFYWQAATYVASNGRVCLTNGAMAFVMP